MRKNEKNFYYEDQGASSRFADVMPDEEYDPRYEKFNGFSSRREMIIDSIQNYFFNCKTMLLSSLNHLRAPSTIIVIIGLVALYIILTVAGIVGFEFSVNDNIRQMRISLDIVVNALLGFFYGPVTGCISFTLCCLLKMVLSPENDFFLGYVMLASIAGFIHGWILYRHKTLWFGTRFRGFFTDLLVKSIITRLVVSIVINILLKGLILYIYLQYPLDEFILHYKYSEVALSSFSAFLEVFVAGLIVDTLVIFLTLSAINFIAAKAFPVEYEEPELLINENDALNSLEEDDSFFN